MEVVAPVCTSGLFDACTTDTRDSEMETVSILLETFSLLSFVAHNVSIKIDPG